jgi:hypothetical protein
VKYRSCLVRTGVGSIHIRDVAHTMALCVERQYKKEEDFKSFIREISEVKCRENMRPYAHLLPPGQRKDSRFMNLSGTIDWAMKMFSNFRKLGKEGKEIFSFLNKYQFMINELSFVFDVSQKILTLFR